MTDTHTHIYMPEFDGGVEALARAVAAGVERVVLPAVDEESIEPMLALRRACPARVSLAFALHPTEVDWNWRGRADAMLAMLDTAGVAAVGETGIDLYWDTTYAREQMEAFALHLEAAATRSLPVIIHCREALDQTLGVIAAHRREHGGELPVLVMHSFTGSADDVRRIREVCDPWFGINGVVTFKNAGPLHEAVAAIGLDRILLETDSPYLAPVPMRGKRNESACLPYIRDKVASLLGADPAGVERATDANARNVFGL